MNNRGDAITLDDVLDFYLTLSEETGTEVLTEIIERFPQYEDELREFAAFRKINNQMPDREYTDEEVQIVNSRAVSIVQNLLYQKRQESVSAEKPDALSCLRDEIESQYANPDDFYQKTGLSEGIIWTLDACQVIFQTVPQKAIENIAAALRKSHSTIVTYLQGGYQVAPSHYKAEQAPEASGKCTFSELINADDDLTEEQKVYWLAQPAIGSDADKDR